MIFITGDCHGAFSRFNTENFPEQKYMTKEDFVIICGDFGGVFCHTGENRQEKYQLDWLDSKPWTTLFIDGNHENFERLSDYPEKEFCGGKVHMIRPGVLHLMRGYVFCVDGIDIFAFGGAHSHDIKDGILEPEEKLKIKKWRNDYSKRFRINKVSWWKQEVPSEEEYQRGINNLDKCGWKVDFIVIHDCTASAKRKASGGCLQTDEINDYFEMIKDKCEFFKWFAGHLHQNMEVNKKEILIYEQIIRVR